VPDVEAHARLAREPAGDHTAGVDAHA